MIVSQPAQRKSRSISRYFLGQKRASIDGTSEETTIHRCLTSAGIFDSYLLWTYVTFYRDDHTSRRLFILTEKHQLIIAKSSLRQSSLKIKERLDLTKIWFQIDFDETIGSEITSLSYYDSTRSMIIGWPAAENFIVEFQTKSLCETWKDHFQSILQTYWQMNHSTVEHVRVVIDSNSSCLIRKVIVIRPDETVRDLIRKCLDASHLSNRSIDDYTLFVHQDPLAVHSSSTSMTLINRPLIGHEYPYSIKMKHLKATSMHNHSFDQIDDQHSQSLNSIQHNSSSSLNSFNVSQSHDFELKQREIGHSDHPVKKHRFFHKRRTKLLQPFSDEQQQPFLQSPNRLKKSSSYLFGQTLDELLHQHDQQLPPVIMQLLNILYVKGPETTGIFRKVANTRSVKECVEKIERNQTLNDDELHPILVACLFKHFLRTLPEPVFNSIQYDHWKKCLRLVNLTEKIHYARTTILPTLSRANLILLKGLICILYRISQHADMNGMNSFNLGLCISNSLFKTESTTITSGKQEADVMSSIVEFLIENCSILFGSDVITCIPEKSIYQLENSTKTTHRINASSMESLDEVESSSPLPLINRSHDSGLAASDPPFNDDSSAELSEHIRRYTLPTPTIDWSSSISSGTGVVLSSISLPRRRSSRLPHRPSKQFLEREKLCQDTTDESDHPTPTTNPNSNKVKRTKSLSRHSDQTAIHRKESRRITPTDAKRTRSLKRTETIRNDDEEKPQEKSFSVLQQSAEEQQQQDLDLTQPIKAPERLRTFVHQSNSRRFVLSEPIQMKPIESIPIVSSPRRPTLTIVDQPNERRVTSVKDKARLFEHYSTAKLSMGRENYV